MKLTHLVLGPPEHGVTEYGLLLHQHTGGRVARSWEEVPQDGQPVHVTFTDHLFGPDPDSAANAVISALQGRPWSISLHDIPQPEEGAARLAKRSAAYRRVAEAATFAVTNSQHEARFFDTPVRVAHLPVPEAPKLPVQPEAGSIGILGFIYPGKGHADILAAASEDMRVRALGTFSEGHEDMDLPGLDVTGYLPDADLWQAMATIAVPVCAHRHFSASGSLMRWIAAGRRVLVADSPYTREIQQLWPAQVIPVSPQGWPEALTAAVKNPAFAQPVEETTTHTWPDLAQWWHEQWSQDFGPWLRSTIPAPPAPAQAVSVIIPYYNAPDELQAVLDGVAASDFDGQVEVIIADDGSAAPPAPRSDLDIRVVRQEDQGFRAAAARDLGVAHASHDILVFLDADTVPCPTYLSAVSAHVAGDPDTVVVGSRLQDGVEPAWLHSAWESTHHLRHADETSWRYIISSVLTCSKSMYHRAGGFDPTFVGYGGEDWEFGWRLWNSGAKFLHEPAALAHHLEEEWAHRYEDPDAAIAEKNAESIAVARRVTHPSARPAGVVFETADVVVSLSSGPPGLLDALTVSWLATGITHVRCPEPSALFATDPRVGPDVSGRIEITLQRPVQPPADLAAKIARVEALGGEAHWVLEGQRVAHVRAPRRDENYPPAVLVYPGQIQRNAVRLERLFAGW